MQGSFVSPKALVFFRVFGAGLMFWLVDFLYIKEGVNKKDLPYLLLCSIIGIVVAQNTFLMGLEKTPTINASLIISTTPIIVALFSIMLLGEKMTSYKVLGLFLAGLGTVILLMNKGKFDLSSDYLIGNLLIFLNALAYGLYLVLIKRLLKRYHPITVIRWVFTIALPFILLLSYSDLQKIEWSQFTNYAWIGLVYVVIFATFFTYTFNAFAIKVLSPIIAGLYLYLQPLLTTLLSVGFGKDEITTKKLIAGIFILSGLYFAAKRSRGIGK